MSTRIDKTLVIHDSTIKHLDVVERAILDCLLAQGRATVIPDEQVTK